jgi:hypothetical protein
LVVTAFGEIEAHLVTDAEVPVPVPSPSTPTART